MNEHRRETWEAEAERGEGEDEGEDGAAVTLMAVWSDCDMWGRIWTGHSALLLLPLLLLLPPTPPLIFEA